MRTSIIHPEPLLYEHFYSGPKLPPLPEDDDDYDGIDDDCDEE